MISAGHNSQAELSVPKFPDNCTDIDAITAQPKEGGRHILVSVDLSENSWDAVDFAIRNVVLPADMLTVYHVLDPRDLVKSDDDPAHFRTQNMIQIHNKMKELIKKSGKDILFRVHASWNEDARSAILEKLKQPTSSKYRMLVIGSRGQSNLEGLMMGSVSNYILNTSPIPVVVVRKP
ncbi:hypothetical protein BC833DRAFT_583823 [Globomyces pollinis-pini]|nr:hypothetical protein BC833DRAFT_583823 [Globomyces pollinis-pini]